MLESHDLAGIGRAADRFTRRLHPENYRTYNIDRNINYTNICSAVCDFCAFYRTPQDPEGYILDRDVLLEKIAELVTAGGDQILLQGGMHPRLKLDWYEELLRDIKQHYPQVNIHGFSPPRNSRLYQGQPIAATDGARTTSGCRIGQSARGRR